MIEKASPKRTVSALVCAVLVTVCACLVILGLLSIIPLPLSAFLGAVALLIFTLVCKRYIFCSFEYFLTPGDELHADNSFAVVKIFGKRRTLECNISLYEVKDVKTGIGRRELKRMKRKAQRTYDYTPDLLAGDLTVLVLDDPEKQVLIVIGCSENFSSVLKKRLE